MLKQVKTNANTNISIAEWYNKQTGLYNWKIHLQPSRGI